MRKYIIPGGIGVAAVIVFGVLLLSDVNHNEQGLTGRGISTSKLSADDSFCENQNSWTLRKNAANRGSTKIRKFKLAYDGLIWCEDNGAVIASLDYSNMGEIEAKESERKLEIHLLERQRGRDVLVLEACSEAGCARSVAPLECGLRKEKFGLNHVPFASVTDAEIDKMVLAAAERQLKQPGVKASNRGRLDLLNYMKQQHKDLSRDIGRMSIQIAEWDSREFQETTSESPETTSRSKSVLFEELKSRLSALVSSSELSAFVSSENPNMIGPFEREEIIFTTMQAFLSPPQSVLLAQHTGRIGAPPLSHWQCKNVEISVREVGESSINVTATGWQSFEEKVSYDVASIFELKTGKVRYEYSLELGNDSPIRWRCESLEGANLFVPGAVSQSKEAEDADCHMCRASGCLEP